MFVSVALFQAVGFGGLLQILTLGYKELLLNPV